MTPTPADASIHSACPCIGKSYCSVLKIDSLVTDDVWHTLWLVSRSNKVLLTWL